MDNELRKTMTKKAWLEKCKTRRVLVDFNTGTRTHKSNKDYVRIKKFSVTE